MYWGCYYNFMKKIIPGLLLCIALAAMAYFISLYLPISTVTLAILLGMTLKNTKSPSLVFSKGIIFSEKTILSLAIALMGVKLDFAQFKTLGLPLIFIIVIGISMTIFLAVFIGHLLKIDHQTALLIGVGNAVCGTSAIAAAQGVIQADEEKVGISIAIINFLGTIGIFLLPAIVMFFPFLDDFRGGVLTGNSLQAIGQVSAAGYSISEMSGQIATLVKMGRILMIMPVVLILSFFFRGNVKGSGKRSGIPWYIFGFILFSLVSSLGILPLELISIIKLVSKGLLVTAMSAIGMKITFSTLKDGGKEALITGVLVFLCQIIFSMGLVFFLI